MVRSRDLLLTLLMLAACACQGRSHHLAVVGGRAIGFAEIGAMIEAQAGRPLASTPPELCSALFESYLEEEVVLAASSNSADRRLSVPARGARARQVLASLCSAAAPPTEAQVESFLAERRAGGGTRERLLLRQLILPDQAAARSARERVQAGEDFGALSREVSRAPNAATGGMIGWVERGQLPPEFEAAVFGLGAGQVSEPVASNAGWHVFQIFERRAAGASPDSGLREQARAQLAARSAEEARRICLRELAARVGVQVDCSNVPFPCRNPFEVTS
jgi:hypothetical protein